MPDDDKVNYFLGLILDISYQNRKILARPVIFIRSPITEALLFDPETEIYTSVKAILNETVEYLDSRKEINFRKDLNERDLNRLMILLREPPAVSKRRPEASV